MRNAALLAVLSLASFGCDKLRAGRGTDAGGADAGAAIAAAPLAVDAGAAPSASTGKLVGDVPGFVADKPTPACAVSPAAKVRIATVAKGDLAALADLPKLVAETGADTCFAARKALAQGLNDGGFDRYSKKKLDEALRFWKAALTVRPSLIIARYNYACALALVGRSSEAVAQIGELATVASEQPAAQNFLEKAKSDDDLKSVRNDPAFQASLRASSGVLVGPRKEPETAAKVIPLLPEELKRVKPSNDAIPTVNGWVTYKPAVQSFWTWRPDGKTELLVATIVDDPAKVGKPKGDMNVDYGAIAVLQRRGSDLVLRLVRKTGESPPTAVAAGKNGSVTFAYEMPCGGLTGTFTWNGSSVDVKEKRCEDL